MESTVGKLTGSRGQRATALLDRYLLDHLQDAILASCTVGQFLQGLADLTAEVFSSAGTSVHCGMFLVRERKPVCMAFSTNHSHPVEELASAFSHYPFPLAVREQKTVDIPDLRLDTEWVDQCPAAEQLGIRSLLCIPLNLGEEGLAGLILSANAPESFDIETTAQAQAYALRIRKPVRIAARLAAKEEQAADLKAAMESRTAIDLAMGVVMGQNRCSQEEAFAILRSACSRRNIKLRDLASLVLASIGETRPRTHFDF